jgi:magnesium transporter
MKGRAKGKNKARVKRKVSPLTRRSRKAGLPPGTLVHLGEKRGEPVRITCIDYDERHVRERQVQSVAECLDARRTSAVTWINIDGIDDIPVIEALGKAFDLHPLVLEDIVAVGQRPKFEDYERHGFIVLKMLRYDAGQQAIDVEQVGLVFGEGFVVSFQERQGDVFDPVRDRIRGSKGRIRKVGADYLTYALIDSVVDSYFSILERVSEGIEALEEELVGQPSESTLHRIHGFKREMIVLRRSIWPLRELAGAMQREEVGLVSQQTRVYLRDVYDHTIQIIDTIESFRDIVSGMLDLYLSSISNRMNAVMKVLTIIATVFIPLTFVAGIYGMNFKHMPELEWRWGYPVVLLVMLALALVMFAYFRKKKWL